MLAITQTTGYIIVGLVAGAASFTAAVLAFRANKQATKVGAEQTATTNAITAQGSLISDLQEERTSDRAEVKELRNEVIGLRLELAESKRHYQQCDDERTTLRLELERLR